ncbi:MAG TPA: clan AA aspartic protease [Chloroflexi bacterium]|nr:clan AA aspartic protease [Chloroflexota bacterium]
MGEVKVKVRLCNFGDLVLKEKGLTEEVRSLEIQGLVDTGAVMVMLPQDMVEALGLKVNGKVIVTYADERKEERPIASGLLLKIGDREMLTDCVVGPPGSEPLIGQLVLERLDLIVDPVDKQLKPRPESPYLPTLKMK